MLIINMCKHKLRYMLKEHTDGTLAGIMLGLDGIVAHGKTENELEKHLDKKSRLLFKIDNKLHTKALNNELVMTLRSSTMGTPKQFNTIIVDCGPHA